MGPQGPEEAVVSHVRETDLVDHRRLITERRFRLQQSLLAEKLVREYCRQVEIVVPPSNVDGNRFSLAVGWVAVNQFWRTVIWFIEPKYPSLPIPPAIFPSTRFIRLCGP